MSSPAHRLQPVFRGPSLIRACLVVASVLVAACSGDSTGPGNNTPVVTTVNVSPGSASLVRGETVQLAVTVLDQNGNELSGHRVTWSTSDAGVATISSTGLVQSVADGQATITATVENHAGSATVAVTHAGLDYAILDAQLTQGVQMANGSIPMVLQGNGAVVNVLMSASVSTTEQVPLVLHLYDATSQAEVFSDTATTFGKLVASPTYGAPTVQFLVPPSVLRPGLTWQVKRDPAGAFPDDSADNDVFPRSGPSPIETVDVPTLKVRFVPIVLSSNGNATGNVGDANLDEYTRVLLSVYPLGRVDFEVGTALTTSASFGTPPQGGASSFWTQVLQELDMARVADPDASGTYWYGVVRPPSGFNYTFYGGYGYIPGNGAATGTGTRTALGVQVGWFNVESQARDLVAHELGHNFGRQHAPCGDASGIDPNYPVAGGLLDRPGHDAFAWTRGFATSAATIPASTGDVMGYCHPVWASTYTYQGVLDFRGAAAVAPPARTTVLYVRGVVGSGGVRLEPALTLDARPTSPASSGRYRLDGLAADGSVLFTRSFDPAVIDHAPSGEGTFAVAVPVDAGLEARLETLRVRGPAGEAVRSRAVREAPSPVSAPLPEATRASAEMARLTCASATEAVLVRDPDGHVLGTAVGGSILVRAAAGASLTVGCSDGVHTASYHVIAR